MGALSLVTEDPTGTRQTCEQESLIRLMKGYQAFDDQDWREWCAWVSVSFDVASIYALIFTRNGLSGLIEWWTGLYRSSVKSGFRKSLRAIPKLGLCCVIRCVS